MDLCCPNRLNVRAIAWSCLLALASNACSCDDDDLTMQNADATPIPADATPVPDLGFADAAFDSGTPDTGQADAAVPDLGVRDSGTPDATPADAMDDAGTLLCEPPSPPLNLMPGAVNCAGCPTSTPPASFTMMLGTVTTVDLAGTVTGASGDGAFLVVGAGGRQIDGRFAIDAQGDWMVRVPLFCGQQQVVLAFCNASGRHLLVYDITTTCTEPDLRLTISWDELGDDWELHLIRPGGKINDGTNDCTWTTCLGGGLDWGVMGDPTDNPLKDVDDVDGYGPENITLRNPEPGTFTVMVEHWGPGSPMSDGEAIINVVGQMPITVPIVDFPPQWVRTVATITFPGGVVRTSTAIHDCTANWSGGCRDPIP